MLLMGKAGGERVLKINFIPSFFKSDNISRKHIMNSINYLYLDNCLFNKSIFLIFDIEGIKLVSYEGRIKLKFNIWK